MGPKCFGCRNYSKSQFTKVFVDGRLTFRICEAFMKRNSQEAVLVDFTVVEKMNSPI